MLIPHSYIGVEIPAAKQLPCWNPLKPNSKNTLQLWVDTVAFGQLDKHRDQKKNLLL